MDWRRGMVLMVAVTVAACSSGDGVRLHPVKGQVLYKGQPVAGAMVVFHPLDVQAAALQKPMAYTDADGRFTLMTERPGDGASAGDHVVTVELREKTSFGREKVKARNLLPSRYAKVETSGLRCRVQEGANDLPAFTLTDK